MADSIGINVITYFTNFTLFIPKGNKSLSGCDNDTTSCSLEYTGYTDRPFTIRFQYRNTAKHNNPESMVAKHLTSNNTHRITLVHLITIQKLFRDTNVVFTYES